MIEGLTPGKAHNRQNQCVIRRSAQHEGEKPQQQGENDFRSIHIVRKTSDELNVPDVVFGRRGTLYKLNVHPLYWSQSTPSGSASRQGEHNPYGHSEVGFPRTPQLRSVATVHKHARDCLSWVSTLMEVVTMATQVEPIAPRYIRPTDFEARTGMSKWAAYRALHDGTLRGVKVRGSWLIERTELDNYFDRVGKRPATAA